MSAPNKTDPFVATDEGLFVSAEDVERLQVEGGRYEFVGDESNQEYVFGLHGTDIAARDKNRMRLNDFFPRIRESRDGGETGLLYEMKVAGQDRAAKSKPIGRKGKIPENEIRGLRRALEDAEYQVKNDIKVNGQAKRVVLSLKLPDPEADGIPDFYRTWGLPWDKKLMVLWGSFPAGKDLVPWREALESLEKRSRTNKSVKILFFGVIPAILLLLTGAAFGSVAIYRGQQCQQRIEESMGVLANVGELEGEVDKNLELASRAAGDRGILELCDIENKKAISSRDALSREAKELSSLGLGENNEKCLQAKDTALQAMEIIETSINPKIEKIDSLIKDLCGLAQLVNTQITKASGIKESLSEAFGRLDQLPASAVKRTLSFRIDKMKELDQILKEIEDGLANGNFESEESRSKLEGCPVDVEKLKVELEVIQNAREEFAKRYKEADISLEE